MHHPRVPEIARPHFRHVFVLLDIFPSSFPS
jgi:hypothetical protein